MTTSTWPTTGGNWAIEIDGLVKRYRNHRVLRGLSLKVPRGGVHGILGPNGSGKTTTIRILLGLVRANAGDVRLLGHQIPQALPEVIDCSYAAFAAAFQPAPLAAADADLAAGAAPVRADAEPVASPTTTQRPEGTPATATSVAAIRPLTTPATTSTRSPTSTTTTAKPRTNPAASR